MSPALPARLPTMTTQAATLTGISTVAIAVSDQDATKRLFEDSVSRHGSTRTSMSTFAGSTWLHLVEAPR